MIYYMFLHDHLIDPNVLLTRVLRYADPTNTSLRTVAGDYHVPDYDPAYKN